MKDKHSVYQLYLPFIKGGGLFVHCEKDYRLGDEVFLVVKVMNEPQRYELRGQVIWITPHSAQGGRAPGIGVQFLGMEGQAMQDKIESYFPGVRESGYPTETM